MKVNNIKAEHLGGGVVLFKDVFDVDFKMFYETAKEVVLREKDEMYKLSVHPETGEPAYLNKSGYYFDFSNVEQMPMRGSMIHLDKRKEVMELLSFIEDAKYQCLLRYMEIFPISYKNIWWKVKGHIVGYGPGVYLGSHSDTSADYVYGLSHPADQLATRNTVSCIAYINDSVDSAEELSESNFTGGEHYFDFLDITYRPSKGDILMFPSNFIASHEVKPVTGGLRFSYLGWYAHGTPNNDVSEYVNDPILEPEIAITSTNLYMPTLREDFQEYLLSVGHDKNTLPYSITTVGN
jgi:hypothetical protein